MADASSEGVEARLLTLEPGAGTGFWIVPYQEISPTSIRFPLDLVFLDSDRVVLATVESFPLSSLPDSSINPGSVLTLPAATVAKGEMRVGDRLLVADPEEMKQHLQRMKEAKPETQAKKAPIEPAPAKAEIAAGKESGGEKRAVSPPVDLGAWKKRLGSRNWLTNLLLGDPADPRAALRNELPGLIAYFFTGGTPMAQEVRDISVTGMYILTNERWYPGTVVRVTLTDRDHPTPERTLTVNAQAVRWGGNGVGLEFILEEQNAGMGATLRLERTLGVDQSRVEAFLQELKKSPSQE